MEVLYFQNDNILRLDELIDAVSGGTFINTATVTAQLKTLAGAGVGAPIALPYVAASNGRYEGIVPDDVAVSLGVRYTAEIIADAGANKRGVWQVPVKVVVRET